MSRVYGKTSAFPDFPVVYGILEFYFKYVVFIVCCVIGTDAGSDRRFHLFPLLKQYLVHTGINTPSQKSKQDTRRMENV
jgi:hypothetical protein